MRHKSSKALALATIISLALTFTITACNKEEETQPVETRAVPKLSDLVVGGTFGGEYYQNERERYKDAKKVEYDVEFAPEAVYHEWIYNYTVKLNGAEVASAEEQVLSYSNHLIVTFSRSELFETGEIEITVTSAKGDTVIVGRCPVYKSPDPTIADLSGVVVNESETVALPGTQLRFTLPDGFTLSDKYITEEADYNTQRFLDSLILYADLDYEEIREETGEDIYAGCGLSVTYEGEYDIDEFHSESKARETFNTVQMKCIAWGIDYETDTIDFELGDYTCHAYIFRTVPTDEVPIRITAAVAFVGDNDTVYRISVTGADEDLGQVIVDSVK